MTGRELIVHILENGLEDVSMFETAFYQSFPTVKSVAVAFNVGIATVEAWVQNDCLDSFEFDGVEYITPSSLNRFTKKKGNKELSDV